MRSMESHSSILCLYALVCIGLVLPRVRAAENVDPNSKYAWTENTGWVNAAPVNGGVALYIDGTNSYLTGCAWGENIGWIKFGDNSGGPYNNNSATNWGVNLDAAGKLFGYAWGENVGWIKFDPNQSEVTLDMATGRLNGYAWGENFGWVRFTDMAFVIFQTATGTPIIQSGGIAGVTVVNGGAGYTNTPLVRFFGGGGTGAVAVAVVSNGVVTAINVTDGGYGYTGTPIVVISPPFIQQPVADTVTLIALLTSTNLAVGTSYQLQTFQSAVWINIGSAFTAASSTYSTYSRDRDAYRLAITPVPAQAFATGQVVSGVVVGVTVTDGGWGYVTNPAVQLVGDGSNAVAVSTLVGDSVSTITVLNGGSGYTNGVDVQIDPPPAVTAFTTITPMIAVNFSHLSPYDGYQLESVQNLRDMWSALGGQVLPTVTTNTFYVPSTNSFGFYRVQYLP